MWSQVRHEAVKLLLSVSLDAYAVKLFEHRPTALEQLWELTDTPPVTPLHAGAPVRSPTLLTSLKQGRRVS